ncbi:zinc finger and BTB domain-containing protein 49-like [Culex pipiens pallens]|uniref:zinc finger and BTB domain-containing protein 49-like n=1 Tax=Culex pipiens pallens TaxID=42434 RepID=UPI001952FB1C|nr:zinc finger and BTB domain-containing protein 49-like [Culex pipiens pallens]
MAKFGLSFYDDELKDNDLLHLAEDVSASNELHLPTIVSISFVESTKVPIELPSMEIEGNTEPSSEANPSNIQSSMTIDQSDNEQSRSPSPASSEASSAEIVDLVINDTANPQAQVKKARGRKITLPRGAVIPGEFYCDKCKRNFRSQRGLRQHANTHHTGIKVHGCEICGKRFDLLEEMQKHRERHSTENKPFACRVDGCPKRFMHEFDMERHLALKHGKAPHGCDICSKVFGRKDHLEKHKLSHQFNTVKKIKN